MSIEETSTTCSPEYKKSNSELLEQISQLKAENALLQSLVKMTSHESVPSEEQRQRLQQVYPHIVEMLTNDGFKEAYRLVLESIRGQMFQTSPDDTAQRECLYHQERGLVSVLSKLGSMARTVQLVKPDH